MKKHCEAGGEHCPKSAEEWKELEALFEHIDADNNGEITVDEAKAAYEA